MMRGPELVVEIAPTLGSSTLLFGFEKFTQLKMLKNSERNSNRVPSVTGKYLTMLKSIFFWPGPVRMFLPDVP